MKPKIKEGWVKEAVIKVKILLETTEYPENSFTNKEKLINIQIDKGTWKSSCSFGTTKKGKKEALEFIKEELYL